LGLVAVSTQLELVLVMIGIVFVAETLSVILQVAIYKSTGKRIFRCAPLHHHFQFSGWSERRTVTRFWFVGGMAAVLTLAGLAFTAMQRRPGEVQLTANAKPGDHAER
jgi:phospho-N-acetylmuramoyl-pentapeptide-transferase